MGVNVFVGMSFDELGDAGAQDARADDGFVIGSSDGDGDGLIDEGPEVIGDACCICLCDRLPCLERLGGGLAVVEVVDPRSA